MYQLAADVYGKGMSGKDRLRSQLQQITEETQLNVFGALRNTRPNVGLVINCLEQLLACYIPSQIVDEGQIKFVESLLRMVSNEQCEYVVSKELMGKLRLGVALLIVSKTEQEEECLKALKLVENTDLDKLPECYKILASMIRLRGYLSTEQVQAARDEINTLRGFDANKYKFINTVIYETATERPDLGVDDVEVPELDLSVTETEFRVTSGASRKAGISPKDNWDDSLLDDLLRCGFWK